MTSFFSFVILNEVKDLKGCSKIFVSLPFCVILRPKSEGSHFWFFWLEKKNMRFFASLRMTSLRGWDSSPAAEWQCGFLQAASGKRRFFAYLEMTTLIFASSLRCFLKITKSIPQNLLIHSNIYPSLLNSSLLTFYLAVLLSAQCN